MRRAIKWLAMKLRTPSSFERTVAALVALGALEGCQSYEEIAHETFSKNESCPPERVTAHEQVGVDAYELTFGKDAEPAAEIKNDPARYAMWKKERETAHGQFNKAMHVVAVKGCDQDAMYTCSTGTDSTGGQVKTCSKVTR